MSKELKPLTDDELEELVYLYRVVRAGNGTPEETKKVKELLERYKSNEEKRIHENRKGTDSDHN